MGEQDQDADTARARLRLLAAEFTTPIRNQSGPRRPTPAAQASAPIDLGVLDQVMKAQREITDHIYTAVPDVSPPPAEAAEIYGWAYKATAHLDVAHRMARDALVYRQSLKHALLMGDDSVIHWEPCPNCACWGLFWQPEHRKALCANRRCTDRLGRPNMWTLRELAQSHVAAKYAARRTAT